MKSNLFPVLLLVTLYSASCKEKTAVIHEETQSQVNNQLTAGEKAGGIMTPELMWKFRRLGTFTLSPDGTAVLYTVTDIDLQTEARVTNIYRLSASGGEPVQLTSDGGSSPQWYNAGKSIAYSNKGNLCTMNQDGSEKKIVAGLTDFEIFSISPAGNNIYYTKRVKLDQTANEKYNLPKAKVRIINDLMYRHWNYWSDFSYSHIFVASFNGSSVSDEKDIMNNQRFESPTAPYFDEGEISWSPDGKFIAYTSKRLSGMADARSTNSDIFLYDISENREINITEENKGYDKNPVFSPDGSMIAYQSMARDGYESDLDRLLIYSIEEGKSKWITKDWVYDVESINWETNRSIYFISSYLGTAQLFKTNTADGKVTKVTEGIHNLGPVNLKS